MLKLTEPVKVFLACGGTDMRKSINGLAVIVQEEFQLDLFSSCLFVFCNKGRNKLKMLQWDHNGFWLHYRRLEKGKFQWPKDGTVPVVVGRRELNWLLDGLSMQQEDSHPKVDANIII